MASMVCCLQERTGEGVSGKEEEERNLRSSRRLARLSQAAEEETVDSTMLVARITTCAVPIVG